VVRTFTPAHDLQQNDLWSAPSQPVVGTTAPVNDDFDQAFTIGSLPYAYIQRTTSATSATDDPTPSEGQGVGKTVWYHYTPATQ
jgi:hypothetical protein